MAEKTAQEMAGEINDTLATLKQELEAVKTKETATPEDVQAATKALEDFKTENASTIAENKAVVEQLVKDLKDSQAEIKSIKDAGSNKTPESFNGAVSKALKENFKGLQDFMSKKAVSNTFEIKVLKVAGNLTNANIGATTDGDVYAAQGITSVSEFPRQEIFLEQYLDVASTELASIPFMDELPGEGDAAIVAEGSPKPLIDADYELAYSRARKVAGKMKASEEVLSDYGWVEGAIQNTLRRKHDIARQADLLGATNGLLSFATPFNAAILGGVKVDAPQYYDVLAALVAGISSESEGSYVPNVIFVNTLDNLKKMLTKDANQNYVMPPFADADGNIIEGVRVVAKPSIAAGTFIVGDFKNVILRNLWEYTVRFGWENADFTNNMITMVGESRYHLYTTTNDKRGIVSGTFADVITALTAI